MSNTVPNAPESAVPAGYTITYTQDTAIGDGWWADLRDGLGRVRESGGGHTQEEARARLLERVARDPLAEIDRDPRPYTLGGQVLALLARGFEVTFSLNTGAGDRFFVNLEKDGDPDAGVTAGSDTLDRALWAASPLHGDDEPFPGGACACGHAGGSHWEIAEPGNVSEVYGPRAGCAVLGCRCAAYAPGLPAPAIETDVRTLSADMADVFGRLNILEARHDKFDRAEAALVDALVGLLVDSSPDGELACRLAERRAAQAAAAKPAAGVAAG
jgi:hypothetical protein